MAPFATRVPCGFGLGPGSRRSRSLARLSGLILTLALTPAACAQPPGASEATTDGTAAYPDTALVSPVKDPGPMAQSLGKFLAGRAAQYANDIPSAAENYRAALAADPDNADLIRRAYYYLTADGRFDEAVPIAQRAMDQLPDDDFAPLLLAAQAMRDGDAETAVSLMDGLEAVGLNTLFKPMLGAWARLARGDDLTAVLKTLQPAASMSSARPLVDLHAAVMARVAGDMQVSRERLDAYLKDHRLISPRNGVLAVSLLVWQGRLDEARALVKEEETETPGSLLVQQLADRLQAPDPLAALTGVPVSARDGFAEALYQVGAVVNQGQVTDTAIVLFRLALAVRPNFPNATVAIAETLRRMERFADADQVLASLGETGDPALDYVVQLYRAENLENLDRIDEALARYQALADQWPQQAEPLVDMGDLLRRQDRYADAAKVYGQGIARLSDDSPYLWPILYRRGIAFERAGSWDEAEADFLHALKLQPHQPEVLNYLGYSWLDRGEHIERAVDMIREAVRQRPRDGYIVDSLGWGYYLLGRYPEAVDELERAVELRPQDVTINDHLGDAYWRVGRHLEARFQWERALSLEPEPEDKDRLTRKLQEGLPSAEVRKPVATTGGTDL